MPDLQAIVAVAMGGALGAVARFMSVTLSAHMFGPAFPWGTLSVNVVGSLLMGMVAKWFLLSGHPSESARLFLTTGFLGGFTTFSTFSLDAVSLAHKSAYGLSAAYVLGSVVASLAALLVGFMIMDAVSAWAK